jgi:hypothetical protein
VFRIKKIHSNNKTAVDVSLQKQNWGGKDRAQLMKILRRSRTVSRGKKQQRMSPKKKNGVFNQTKKKSKYCDLHTLFVLVEHTHTTRIIVQAWHVSHVRLVPNSTCMAELE